VGVKRTEQSEAISTVVTAFQRNFDINGAKAALAGILILPL
jgi:hypothetical protein